MDSVQAETGESSGSVSSPPVIRLTVLTSPARAWRNGAARQVAERLLEYLRADERLLVEAVVVEGELPPPQGMPGLVLNLSAAPVERLRAALGPASCLLMLRLLDGETCGMLLSDLALMPRYLYGIVAVKEYPSIVGLELLAETRGAKGEPELRSFGAWYGRSHVKSTKRQLTSLLEGCYLPLDCYFAYLRRHAPPLKYPQARSTETLRKPAVGLKAVLAHAEHGLRYCWRTMGNLRHRGKATQWNIGIAQVSDAGPSDPPELPTTLHWVEPRVHGFFADPFLMVHAGQTVVFFEELDYNSEWHGVIAAASVLEDGTIDMAGRRTVLEIDGHLSFPFVFEHDGAVYMMPEQAGTGRLDLYGTTSFPGPWTRVATLLANTVAADPVLYEHEGFWYLFFSDARHGNHDNNLQLFVAASPMGPYRCHPCSPLRLSLDGSRMAGPILKTGDGLLRFGQDCRQVYGGGVVAFRIEELTPNTYREARSRSVGPDRQSDFSHAYHTYSQVGDWIVADRARLIRP